MISFNLCLLGSLWACHTSFMYYSFPEFILPSILVGLFLLSSWASSAHFIPLGILDPSHSFLLPTFLWAFTKNFRLPYPNYHILYFWVYWPLNQSHLLILFFRLLWPIFACFLLLMIPLGLLLPSLRLPWAHLLSLEPFYYFVRLCIIIPTIQA